MAVKRFLLCFLMAICMVSSVFAADFVESDSDMFGFAFDDSDVYFTDKALSGDVISVDSQLLSCSRLYFYIPVPKPLESLDFYFSLIKTTGNIVVSACDYGVLFNYDYRMTASLDLPSWSWLDRNTVEGSSAQYISVKCSWSNLPFTTSSSFRFIRLTVDYSNGTGNLLLWTQKNLTQGLSGVLGNPTYSFSGTNDGHFVNYFSGSFETDPVYIQGQLKSQYWDGSAVKVFSGSLLNSTSGSGGYLRIPKLTIHAANPSVNSMKFHALESAVTGTLTPSFASQNTDLQGTYLARNYVNTVSMSATRGYSDQELIQAVDNGFSRNHQDLQGLSDQLGQLVQHQDQVNQTGDNIGSATSDSSIQNTSGNLASGSNGLSGVLGSASDIQSVSGAAAPYIGLIGAALPIVLNFGNGVLAWACIGIVACSVFLFILKKVSQ